MSTWTEELKAKLIQEYLDKNPTPENSTELVKEIAEASGQSANGLRMVLSQAKVYVKKGDAGTATSSTDKPKEKAATTRVSKESSIQALKDAIEAAGKTVDADILDKLTGKAAIYLLTLVK